MKTFNIDTIKRELLILLKQINVDANQIEGDLETHNKIVNSNFYKIIRDYASDRNEIFSKLFDANISAKQGAEYKVSVLKIVLILVQHDDILKEKSEESEEEDTDGDTDDAGEDSNAEKAGALVKGLKEDFTFIPLIQEKVFIALDSNKSTRYFLHQAVELGNYFSIKFTQLKQYIKKILKYFGIEEIFLRIAKLMQVNRFFHYSVKIIGTLFVPAIMLLIVFIAIFRWTTNPIQKTLKWLSREFDIKLPDGAED